MRAADDVAQLLLHALSRLVVSGHTLPRRPYSSGRHPLHRYSHRDLGIELKHRDDAPVLVTGATGLIGWAVCIRLRHDRRPVIATHFRCDRSLEADGIAWLRADLRQPHAIDEIGEVSAVVHLAANIPYEGDGDERRAADNRAIDESVLCAALRRRVPVVYASTGALYGGRPPKTGWSESAPLAPVGPYLEEKVWAESLGIRFAERYGIPFAALRINAPYGPAQRARTVMQLFVDQALAGGPLTYFGSGSREQDFTYVADVADACVAALDGPSGTFNVAGGEPVTMRHLAEMVAQCAGLDRRAVVAGGRPDRQEGRRVAFDLSRSAQLLGWAPRVRLQDGIGRCLRLRAGA